MLHDFLSQRLNIFSQASRGIKLVVAEHTGFDGNFVDLSSPVAKIKWRTGTGHGTGGFARVDYIEVYGFPVKR